MRCRLLVSWLTNSALVYEPKCGGGGRGCGVSANDYSCAHGALINFGDPYLTYVLAVTLSPCSHTVIRFVWVSAKFGTCTVVSVNGTHVEEKMRRFKGEFEHFSFNECPIYTHDGASAKLSTNSHETDNSAAVDISTSEIIREINWTYSLFSTLGNLLICIVHTISYLTIVYWRKSIIYVHIPITILQCWYGYVCYFNLFYNAAET